MQWTILINVSKVASREPTMVVKPGTNVIYFIFVQRTFSAIWVMYLEELKRTVRKH